MTAMIILIGVTGSGKTTVGRLLAQRLSLPLHEVDNSVETQLGAPLRQLVITHDPRLAQARRAQSRTALEAGEGIVTLGASDPLDPAIASYMEEAQARGAHVVELKADIGAVSRRENLSAPRSVGLGAPRAMLAALMEKAREVYVQVADTTVDTSALTPDQVAEAVLKACKLAGD